MDEDAVEELFAIVIGTAQAHHQYQENILAGEYNTHWSDWYSDHMIKEGINKLIDQDLKPAELKQILLEFDKQYKEDNPNEEWPVYYTKQFLKKFATQ